MNKRTRLVALVAAFLLILPLLAVGSTAGYARIDPHYSVEVLPVEEWGFRTEELIACGPNGSFTTHYLVAGPFQFAAGSF